METLLFWGIQDWLQTKVEGKKKTRGVVSIAGAKQNFQMSEQAATPPRRVGWRCVGLEINVGAGWEHGAWLWVT